MENTVGRKSDLTEELTLEIRKLYLDGENYKNIQEILDIVPGTWDRWVYLNYRDFRTKLQNWKKERLVRKAEINLDILMDSEDERVRTSNTQFTLETLGKEDGYSKRTELTGKDGTALTISFDPAFKKDGTTPQTETNSSE
jgi:hypothetical protein